MHLAMGGGQGSWEGGRAGGWFGGGGGGGGHILGAAGCGWGLTTFS